MIISNLKHLAGEKAGRLLEFHQGIEKEGLRALENMTTSQRPHHKALGHKLSHPYITTDYAENLLEFVTPVFASNERLLNFISDIQSYSLKMMDQDETIWPSSMPCILPSDEQIPIADFGKSNVGKIKSLYRVGLGYRYGRSMQSIAGMHFNLSFSRDLIKELHSEIGEDLSPRDFTNQIYFKMIRNFRRSSWLLSYLFGASPVVDESFLRGKKHTLQKLGKDTWGREYATSLRMGGLGYTSEAQKDISVCYNKVDTYVATLEAARKRSYPAYEKIGVKVDGVYRQLNSNLLQIDNEFYSPLRPKRTARSGESALQALHQGGVEYIEVRLLDLNPFASEGISEEGIKFLQLFLTYCLLEESPVIESSECEVIENNFNTVVNDGRNPNAKLNIEGKDYSVVEAATKILENIQDLVNHSQDFKNYYQDGLDAQWNKLKDPSNTLSSKVLEMVSEAQSFVEGTSKLANSYKEELVERKIPEKEMATLIALAKSSLRQEDEMVAADTLDFDTFLREYFDKINIKEFS